MKQQLLITSKLANSILGLFDFLFFKLSPSEYVYFVT